MNVLNWFLTAVNALGALSGIAFLVIYSKRSVWWHPPRGDKNREHRAHLGYFTLSLTLIMTLYVFRPFIDPVTFAYFRAPMYLAVVVCMVWRLTLLLRSKRTDRARTDHEDAAHDEIRRLAGDD